MKPPNSFALEFGGFLYACRCKKTYINHEIHKMDEKSKNQKSYTEKPKAKHYSNKLLFFF